MAVQLLSSMGGVAFLAALSTDVLPNNVPNGSLCLLTDTGNYQRLNGAGWAPISSGGATQTIFNNGSGWSPFNGTLAGATASNVIANIVGRLTIPAGVLNTVSFDIGSGLNGPHVEQNLALNADLRRWSALVRIAATTNVDGNTHISLYCRRGTNKLIQLDALGLGAVNCWIDNVAQNKISASNGLVPLNGTGWLRITRLDSTICFYYGTGVGANPPSSFAWTMFYQGVTVLGSDGNLNHDTIGVSISQYTAGPAANITVDFSPLIVEDFGFSLP